MKAVSFRLLLVVTTLIENNKFRIFQKNISTVITKVSLTAGDIDVNRFSNCERLPTRILQRSSMLQFFISTAQL
jgi:hypothetical protein